MRTHEQSHTIDRDLVRRADRKFRRYGTNLNGVLSVLVSIRGLPNELRPVPSVIEFDAQGEHFIADVTPDGDCYSAQVRNHPECYTCGGNEAELRRNLVEAAELAIFDIADTDTLSVIHQRVVDFRKRILDARKTNRTPS